VRYCCFLWNPLQDDTTTAVNIFFFFYCRYNPLWVLAFSVILLHSVLSLLNFLHPPIPNAWMSCSISSTHLFLGLPLILLPVGFHSNTLFVCCSIHVSCLQKCAHIPGSKTHYRILFLTSQSTSLPWGQSSFNHSVIRKVCFFPGQGCRPCAQPPTWRTRVSLFVWVIILDLSGMGGPTSSVSYRQHSSRVHVTTQAPPLRQSTDTIGGQQWISLLWKKSKVNVLKMTKQKYWDHVRRNTDRHDSYWNW
jgi:hypothetical protein